MPVVMNVITQAIPGTTGNQTFTGSLGGATPDCCIVIVTRTASEGSWSDNVSYCIGFSDGTNEQVCGVSLATGFADAEAYRNTSNDACAMTMNYISTGARSKGVASFSANTVTLNWSGTMDTGRCTVIMISGATNAVVGSVLMSTAQNSTFTVNPGAWTPNCGFFLNQGMTDLQALSNAHHSFGFAAYNGSVTRQFSLSSVSNNNASTMNAGGIVSNGRVSIGMDNVADTADYGIDLTNWDDVGGEVEFQVLDGPTDGTEYLNYLLLEVPDNEVDAISQNTKTTTGTEDYEFLGLNADNYLSGVICIQANDNTYSDTTLNRNDGFWPGQAVSAMAYITSTTANVANQCYTDEDDVADSDNSQRQGAEAIFIADDNAGTNFDADWDSWSAQTVTLDYQTSDGIGVRIPMLAFGGVSVPSDQLLEREYPRGIERGILKGVV